MTGFVSVQGSLSAARARAAAPASGFARLAELRELLQPRAVFRLRDDVAITGLADDSRRVRPGSVFFAVPGLAQDGARYAEEAVARGAVAVVSTEPLDLDVPVLMVHDVRTAVADAACAWYRHPSASLDCVGVTGTNGKTTTAYLVRHCLRADDRRAGLLGTIGYDTCGNEVESAKNTTPGPLELQRLLRTTADRGAGACVMEVSSHALVQERVRGTDFDVATFLNLTRDHLDYHLSMREYGAAKARLFAMLKPGAIACLPAGMPYANVMADALHAGVRVVRYGRGPLRDEVEPVQIRAHSIRSGLDGSRFTLAMPRGSVDVFLPLPGVFQVDNALAAAATAWALGVSELTIAGALETATPVRGRLEEVVVPRPRGDRQRAPRVFVDYAHTPDALDKACNAIKSVCPGPLTVVFGCGGDRDREKRPMMAEAVARHADVVFLTSDNPRSEDPERILDDAQAGLVPDPTRDQEFYRVRDRAEAIERAIETSVPGGVVLVAGKGHETGQIVGDDVLPFDDRAVARDVLLNGGWRW
jgi:UDP-N-acetylmuramoyl-L-alanyl-D-glutamate--2,6-diaminopimelate ligase